MLFLSRSFTSNVISLPLSVHLKYPKPGTPNPVVSVHIYDLASRTTVLVELPDFTSGAPPDDRIVFDLTWVFAAAGGASNDLLVTVTNRTQDARRLVRATIDSETGVVSTTIHRHETTASWFEGVCGGRG